MDTLFIVLNDEDSGLGYSLTGGFLLESLEELDDVAEQLGMMPLTGFISPDPVALEDYLLAEEADDVPPPAVDYFPAELGLRTVRALLAKIAADPNCVVLPEEVAGDLNQCEEILSKARIDGISWRFELDSWEEEE